MSDEDEGDSGFELQAFELELHALTQLEIERREGLVEQQHLRPVGERAGERDALLLSARELLRSARPIALELDERERLFDALSDVARVDALHLQPEGDVPINGKVWEQSIALKHRVDRSPIRGKTGERFAVEQNVSSARLLEARDETK